jgi:hypothetical protein
MCGDIPLHATAQREACCDLHRARGTKAARAAAAAPAHPRTAATVVAGANATAAEEAADEEERRMDEEELKIQTEIKVAADFVASIPRPDLDRPHISDDERLRPEFLMGSCTQPLEAKIPVFSKGPDGATAVRIEAQAVPQLTRGTIARVKRAALAKAPRAARAAFNSLVTKSERARVKGGRGFLHPGGYAGAGELTLLGQRLANGVQPQVAANESLVTVGASVLITSSALLFSCSGSPVGLPWLVPSRSSTDCTQPTTVPDD